MNKNFEAYKSTYSALRPSDEATERILHMTKTRTKKTMKMKPLLAAAACLLLLVTGIFGGSAISGRLHAVKPADNLFTIKAYAQGEAISLKDTPFVQTDLHLQYVDGDTGGFIVAEDTTGFTFDGSNVKSVTYETKRGDINYETRIGNDVKVTDKQFSKNPATPFAAGLTLEIGNDELVTVDYMPSEALETMLRAEKKIADLSTLPQDDITVTVTFRDGTAATAVIHTSFDKNGNMLLEYKD